MITNRFYLHFDTDFTENSLCVTNHPFNYSQKNQSLKQNTHSTIHRKINQWKYGMRTRIKNENQQKQIT